MNFSSNYSRNNLKSNGTYHPSFVNHPSQNKFFGTNEHRHAQLINGQNQFESVEEDDETNKIDDNRPKLLMWGLTKSGKTSIIKLVFEKMTTGETLKLSETKMIQIHELTCAIHIRFQMRDVPGPHTASLDTDFSSYASESTSVIFILDVTEDYTDAIHLLVSSIHWMYSNGHPVRFEVLIHKIDGLHESERFEHYSSIQQQVSVMLHEYSINQPLINFYLTSIYDHSIHEAFSKIVQNQIRQFRVLENMLDLVTSTTQLDKIFVYDIQNKICLASDTKPIERQLSELCADVVDVYTNISSIYGSTTRPLLDSMSFCKIALSIGLVLCLKDINPTTALICLWKKESKINEALMDVNLNILKKNMQDFLIVHGHK